MDLRSDIHLALLNPKSAVPAFCSAMLGTYLCGRHPESVQPALHFGECSNVPLAGRPAPSRLAQTLIFPASAKRFDNHCMTLADPCQRLYPAHRQPHASCVHEWLPAFHAQAPLVHSFLAAWRPIIQVRHLWVMLCSCSSTLSDTSCVATQNHPSYPIPLAQPGRFKRCTAKQSHIVQVCPENHGCLAAPVFIAIAAQSAPRSLDPTFYTIITP